MAHPLDDLRALHKYLKTDRTKASKKLERIPGWCMEVKVMQLVLKKLSTSIATMSFFIVGSISDNFVNPGSEEFSMKEVIRAVDNRIAISLFIQSAQTNDTNTQRIYGMLTRARLASQAMGIDKHE